MLVKFKSNDISQKIYLFKSYPQQSESGTTLELNPKANHLEADLEVDEGDEVYACINESGSDDSCITHYARWRVL